MTYQLQLHPTSLDSYCGGNAYYVSAVRSPKTISPVIPSDIAGGIASNGLSVISSALLPILKEYNENENVEFYSFSRYGAAIHRDDKVNPSDNSSVFDDLEEAKDLMEEATKSVQEFRFSINHSYTTMAPHSCSFMNNPQAPVPLDNSNIYTFTGPSPVSFTRGLGDKAVLARDRWASTLSHSTRFLYLLYKYSTLYDIKSMEPWNISNPTMPIRMITKPSIEKHIDPLLSSNCKLSTNKHLGPGWRYLYLTVLPPLYNRIHRYRSFYAIISFSTPVCVERA